MRQRDCLDQFRCRPLGAIPNFPCIEGESSISAQDSLEFLSCSLPTPIGSCALCGGIDNGHKRFGPFEPKIDNHEEVKFGNSSRWKELSKETGSEILPSGDGLSWEERQANYYLAAQEN
ncbi:hypothetical protein Tco_0313675 [Tanacetum coccineum]